MLIRLLPNVIIGDGLVAIYDPGGPVLKLWCHGYQPEPYRGDQAIEAWDALGRRVAPDPGAAAGTPDVVAEHGRRLDKLEQETAAADFVDSLWALVGALMARMGALMARVAALESRPVGHARVIRLPAIGQRVVCDGGRGGVVHGISLRSPSCDDGVALSVRMDDFGIRSDWSRVHVRAAGPDPRFVEITVRDVSPSPADGPEPDGGADRVDVAGPADAHYRKAGGPIR